MAKIIEWVVSTVQTVIARVKLDRGRCEACERELPDDAVPIKGYRVCSPECAYDAWVIYDA